MSGAACQRAQGRVLAVLGTASNVGKSALVAGLCRLYARRGFRIAPFKAQNMALNSYVTLTGGEIGRSQAYQAHAAGIEPRVDMNPVLLKPEAGGRSQVVVAGRSVGSMDVSGYHAYQAEVWPHVTAALARLRATHDLVVIEGAGSAGEINLRDYDIVNMKLARHAAAPVVLVGDIERGGVFASLVGHVAVFSAAERALVRGFVINRFRGDATVLESGIAELAVRTGVPTLGVVPWLHGWSAAAEDMEAARERSAANAAERSRTEAEPKPLKVVVVHLPHLSNSNDFEPFEEEEDIDLVWAQAAPHLQGAAAIFLPGSKSTVADLAWLRERGFAAGLRAAAAAGTPILGVCGGFQMLGRVIRDPARVESEATEVEGLALLDVETKFAPEKVTRRVDVALLAPAGAAGSARDGGETLLGPAGLRGRGYEIHMGRTLRGPGVTSLLALTAADGTTSHDGAVCGSTAGCYVHGLFDAEALRTAFINRLRQNRGLPARSPAASSSTDIDRFADHVARHLDMGRLDAVIGLADTP